MAICLLVAAIYILRLDNVAGLLVDDAWYVLLARALARGDGYGLVNAPTPIGLTPYPPGFPGILSVAFRLSPEFPANVWLLKSVSIAASWGIGLVAYWYFAHTRQIDKPLSAAIALMTVITPAFVFLATSTVMSECVFTFMQLATVVLVERLVREKHPLRDTLLVCVCAAITMLVRSAGAATIAAVVCYLLYQRLWRKSALVAVGVGVCLAPWIWYAGTHAPTMAQRLEHGGGHAYTYQQNFWMKVADYPQWGFVTAGDLPARVANNLIDVSGRDIGGIVVPSLFRGPNESGEEVVALGGGVIPGSMGSAAGTVAISLALSGLVALGFIVAVRRGPSAAEFLVPFSLVMILLWPFWAYRFVLPLAPFLFFYLVLGIRRLTPSAPVLRVCVLTLIALNLLDHAQYILRSRTQDLDLATDAAETEAVIAWMQQNLQSEGYVASTNPPLVFMRTGRRTVAIDEPEANWQRWKSHGIRYLVSLRRVNLPASSVPYKVLYRSPKHGLWILEI